ncbi:hypothetical protein CWI78_01675 [Idiomarina ramblicola]|uniref:Uncharacterized protein n=1 Tax=Idiomarina ramblicola TaxID=263724 RepID=A0A432Z5L8_9GAMM|nr:hypothetical protein CWI78_01675 [Idiomarina ramblicola]
MKRRDGGDAVNYTLGVTGTSTLIALFQSITRSKALAIMFALGLVAYIFSWQVEEYSLRQ